jgi:SAM-dependent MidA family methyltransferase
MGLALYHPSVGYYRQDRTRVGYGPGTDFYTASTSGPVFGELVAAAAVNLLGKKNPQDHMFVEIGAERGRSILDGVNHPFRETRGLGAGDDLIFEGPCVVFSNELFDAQPFRRFIFQSGRWRELGVKLVEPDLIEVELETPIPGFLPANAPDGYVVDAPVAAANLLRCIAARNWSGVFIACDYGKTWQELIEHTPQGTARAYFQHQQSNALLANAGQQDLTCHVCWDWLKEALAEHGFGSVALESQESFFIKRAGEYIAATTAAEASQFSRKKLSLMQLLHPSHLGQKFEVLHATR